MKKTLFLVLLAIVCGFTNELSAQIVYDYKVKTKENVADRTKMLDILRAKLYEEYRQEFIFAVDKLNVSGGYAWFQGVAKREDGMPVQVDENLDCCHVEALMKVSKGKWYIVEMGAFSTDVWWDGLWERTDAPKKIFFQ
jgi:hypothetical protein